HVSRASGITINQWLQRMMVERLEKKTEPIIEALKKNENNWEDTFYQFLARAFGSRVNAEPFHMLALALPVKILAKHKNSLFQLEALLFGTAGFLNERFADEYPGQLKKEFDFLRKKYAIVPMKKYVWKFLRLRPANFPTIRLAQFSQLVFNSNHLLSKILKPDGIKSLFELFNHTPSAYWHTHYLFDKFSDIKEKKFGSAATELLLINTVVPFLFVYGKLRDEEQYIEKSFQLLGEVPAEKNEIISRWKQTGINAKSAFDSQALLQLKNIYCTNFRCLDCAIGHKILSVQQ
ncbi:MAG: DUF2851 family protein, partial [Chitinophagales bacterium]